MIIVVGMSHQLFEINPRSITYMATSSKATSTDKTNVDVKDTENCFILDNLIKSTLFTGNAYTYICICICMYT